MKIWMKQGLTVCLMTALLSAQGALALEIMPESLTLQSPTGMTLGEDGAIYLVDQYKNQVYQWSEGTMTLVAGVDIGVNSYPEGATSIQDGDASLALFYSPQDIVAYGESLYVADTGNSAIRQIVDGEVYTLLDEDDGLERPTAIGVTTQGNLYLADGGTGEILYYDQEEETLSTYATDFCYPTDIAILPDGTLLVVDGGSHQIKSVSTDGTLSVVAGQYILENGVYIGGYADGTTEEAIFQDPCSILVDGDTIYVTDRGNSAVRKISEGTVTTLVKYDPWADDVYPLEPYDMVLVGDTLYVSDTMGSMIFGLTLQTFDDVLATDWFYDAVSYGVNAGFFQGTSATTFSPQTTMTRAMFVQMLYNMEGAEAVETDLPFTDVGDDWYTEAVAWVSATGITTGTAADTFSPNQSITREQMVIFLYRYVQWLGMDVSTDGTGLSAFADADQLNDSGVVAMEWACSAGIISGINATTLNPQGLATRAEVATMMMNFDSIL